MVGEGEPIYHDKPPQYAVPMDIFERLIMFVTTTMSYHDGLYINISAMDATTHEMHVFNFSSDKLGASAWSHPMDSFGDGVLRWKQ